MTLPMTLPVLYNELLLLFHVAITASLILGALRLGKEALMVLIAMLEVLANFLVTKQTMLFGMEVTTTDVCMMGAILGINLLQEFYGARWAKRAIVISSLAAAAVCLLLQFHLRYHPSPNDWADVHLQALMSPTSRILIASLSVAFASQWLDRFIYAKLKNAWQGRNFTGRNLVSMSLAQILDTVLFTYLGLWGLVASLSHVIFMSLMAKALVLVAMSPFMALTNGLSKMGILPDAEQADRKFQ